MNKRRDRPVARYRGTYAWAFIAMHAATLTGSFSAHAQQGAALDQLADGTRLTGVIYRPPQQSPPPDQQLCDDMMQGRPGSGGSAALLGRAGSRQRMVREGRRFEDGIWLARVHADHVTLCIDGNATKLGLHMAGTTNQITPALNQMQRRKKPEGAGRDDAAPQLSQDLSKEQRQRSLALSLEPVRRDGAAYGFQPKPGAMEPFFANAGVQPGDIIRRINGAGFSRGEDLADLAYDIGKVPSFTITVERAGEILELKTSP